MNVKDGETQVTTAKIGGADVKLRVERHGSQIVVTTEKPEPTTTATP